MKYVKNIIGLANTLPLYTVNELDADDTVMCHKLEISVLDLTSVLASNKLLLTLIVPNGT